MITNVGARTFETPKCGDFRSVLADVTLYVGNYGRGEVIRTLDLLLPKDTPHGDFSNLRSFSSLLEHVESPRYTREGAQRGAQLFGRPEPRRKNSNG